MPRILIAAPLSRTLLSSLCLCILAGALVSCAPAAVPTLQPVAPTPAAVTPVIASPAATFTAIPPAIPTATVAPVAQATPAAPKPQASMVAAVDSEWLVVVRRAQQQIVLYRQGQEQKTYTVSTGKPETITPLGWWKIVEKYPVSPAGIYGTRWLGWQRWNPQAGRYEWYKESPPFGIHGTNEPEKIGTAVSSGCVRLPNRDVEEVYDLLPLGTYVLVVE